jgi:hypothetical protein
MENPTILINVSKKKQNRLLETKNDVSYYIIGENTRKVICNMFDALGNISNYTDYYAFQTNNRSFKSFCKCLCADKLKVSLCAGQGILIGIDTSKGELYLPQKDVVDWILSLHDYEVLKVEEPKGESEEPKVESEEPKKEKEEPKGESEELKGESEEPKGESEEPKGESEEPKKEQENVGYTNRFWKLFGY